MSRELKTMCEDASSSMNKCLVFFAVLAVMGTVSRLGLLNARETVEVARLPKNVNVEISVIAWKG